MIYVTARNYVKIENLNKFKELAKKLIDETVKESGCIEYNVYRDQDDDTIFCFIEKWENIDSLQNHFNSKHFKTLVPELEKYKYKKDEVNIYNEFMK